MAQLPVYFTFIAMGVPETKYKSVKPNKGVFPLETGELYGGAARTSEEYKLIDKAFSEKTTIFWHGRPVQVVSIKF
jgi:hypothetical protein